MSDPTPNIKAIVAKLSEAQRTTVIAMSAEWQAGPNMDDALLSDLAPLRQAGLVEREFGDMGQPSHSSDWEGYSVRVCACWWFRLTPLGILVRNHLTQGDEL